MYDRKPINPEYPPRVFVLQMASVLYAAVRYGPHTDLSEEVWYEINPDLMHYAGHSPREAAINCFDTLGWKGN